MSEQVTLPIKENLSLLTNHTPNKEKSMSIATVRGNRSYVKTRSELTRETVYVTFSSVKVTDYPYILRLVLV